MRLREFFLIESEQTNVRKSLPSRGTFGILPSIFQEKTIGTRVEMGVSVVFR